MTRRRSARRARRSGFELLEARNLFNGDPGDTLLLSSILNLDEQGQAVVAEEIAPEDDVDLYKVVLTEAGTLTFDIDTVPGDGPPLISLVRLFDESGNELAGDANNDRSANPPDPVLTYEAAGGTYYAGISFISNATYNPVDGTGRIPGFGGAYTLNVQFALPGDGNDTIAEADEISLDDQGLGQVSGAVIPEDDVDLYKVVLSEAGTVTFDIDTVPGDGPPLISLVRLFDESGNELAGDADNDRSANPPDPVLTYQAAAGTYYAGISFISNATYNPVDGTGRIPGFTGDYTLNVQFALPGDGNDTIAEADEIGLDDQGLGQVSGAVSPEDDVDLYKVVLSEAGTVTFDIDTVPGDGPPLISLVRLFDENGNELAGDADNDRSANPPDPVLTYQAAAGTYYAGISFISNATYNPVDGTGRIPGFTGDYTLNVQFALPGDGNDTIAEADTIDFDSQGQGQAVGAVDPEDDVDLYKVVLSEAGTVVFDIDTVPGDGPPLISLVRLFDENGNELAGEADNDRSANPPDPVLTFQAAAGTYYAGISFISNATYNPVDGTGRIPGFTGDYTLNVSPALPGDGNDTLAEADPIELTAGAGGATGAIDPASDIDLYQLVLGTRDVLSVSLTPAAGSLDGAIRLFNAAGEVVTPDTVTSGTSASLEFAVRSGGTYYIGVSGAGNDAYIPSDGSDRVDGATGEYALTVDVLAAPPQDNDDTLAAAAAIGPVRGVALERAGGIAHPLDVDFVSLSLGARETLVVTFAASGGGPFDGALRVFDAAGNQVAASTTTASANAAIEFFVPISGTYFIGVSGAGNEGYDPDAADSGAAGATGAYTLSVLVQPVGSELEPNDDASLATAISLNSTVSGQISVVGDRDFFTITLAAPGRLIASANAANGSSLNPTLSLVDFVDSDDISSTNRGARVEQYLPAGVYLLQVQGAGGTNGTYQLATEFVAATSPLSRVTVGTDPVALATADLNGDGHIDVVSAALDGTISVLLGLGDGGFETARTFTVGGNARSVAIGDFNQDGSLDLAVATVNEAGTGGKVVVLAGDGDGQFTSLTGLELEFSSGRAPTAVAAADLTGDSRVDLAIAVSNGDAAGEVQIATVALGPSPLFQVVQTVAVGARPEALLARDVNGDSRVDLVAANRGNDDISVSLQSIAGTFSAATRFAVGDEPTAIVAADFNGDSRLDLAVGNVKSDDVSILIGNVGGGYQTQRRVNIRGTFGDVVAGEGTLVSRLAVGDFDNDGTADLAVSQATDARIAVASGVGDGTFRSARTVHIGGPILAVVAADFNEDGRLDLASAQGTSFADPFSGSTFAVRLGNGDGRFQGPDRFDAGVAPVAIAAGDFNSDSRGDVVVVNTGSLEFAGSGGAALLMGLGNGRFEDPRRLGPGNASSVATGDFNQDGRLDVAIAHRPLSATGFVELFLGSGDGTFLAPVRYNVGRSPVTILAADVNGDSLLDLVTANSFDDSLTLLLGDGRGEFPVTTTISGVGSNPISLAVGDFNGDSRNDLVVGSAIDDGAKILLGQVTGVLAAPATLTAQGSANALDEPEVIVSGRFDGDAFDDLAISDSINGKLTLLFGTAGGTNFVGGATIDFDGATSFPQGLAAADLNADGLLDLAVARGQANSDVAVFFGTGTRALQSPVEYNVRGFATGVVARDFNGDGMIDLALANDFSREVSLLTGVGQGRFVSADALLPGVDSSPLFADFSGDGVADLVSTDRAGNVSVRLGRAGQPGEFDSPRLINPGEPAQAITLATVAGVPNIVALNRASAGVTVYRIGGDGAVLAQRQINLPGRVARVAVGDVNGDGRDDLALAAADGESVALVLGSADGNFSQPLVRETAGATTDVSLADINDDGRRDLVWLNGAAGVVTAALVGPANEILRTVDFAANSPTAGFRTFGDDLSRRTLDGGVTLAQGDFNRDGRVDFIAANRGTNSLVFLAGTPGGGLANPRPILVQGRPNIIRAADFTGDGVLDLAALSTSDLTLEILRGDGQGGFVSIDVRSAGNFPSGLTVADIGGTAAVDLLVGNEYGDVITLLGRDDGTFEQSTRANRRAAIAVGDLDGDGRDDWVVANEARDQLTVFEEGEGGGLADGAAEGLVAPEAVAAADLNGDNILDMVVANSGANEVLVYLGRGQGQFDGPRRFFAGDEPVDVSVADVNGDGRPDVVSTNRGSNDVSVLLGDPQTLLRAGVRLNVGLGPVATTVTDFNTDGRADLVVTNAGSNQVFVLPGIGGGFFNDRAPMIFPTGDSPRQTAVGQFDGNPGLDLATVNFRSNTVTYYTGFQVDAREDFSSGGSGPLGATLGDVNFDGTLDLVVANNFSSTVSLFLGGQDGLALSSTFFDQSLQNPTAVALANVGEDAQLAILVTSEGEDSVFVFSGQTTGSTGLTEGAVEGTSFAQFAGTFTTVAAGTIGAVVQALLGSFVADEATSTDRGDTDTDAGSSSGSIEALWSGIDSLLEAGKSLLESTIRSLRPKKGTATPGESSGILQELFELFLPGVNWQSMEGVIERLVKPAPRGATSQNDAEGPQAVATDAALADDRFDPMADVAVENIAGTRGAAAPLTANKPAVDETADALQPTDASADTADEVPFDETAAVDAVHADMASSSSNAQNWLPYAYLSAGVLAAGAAGGLGYSRWRKKHLAWKER